MKHLTTLGGVTFLLLAVLFTQPASAQRAGQWAWDLKYSAVLGLAETAEFAGGLSWRGVTFDGERAANESLTMGFSIGWHLLDENNSAVSEFADGALSGTAYRYINAVPVLAVGTFFFGQRGNTRPFISGGGGTYWIENRTEAGIVTIEESHWHPGAMGEVGVSIPRYGGNTLTLSARYNWAAPLTDPRGQELRRSYLTFSIGSGTGSN
jgi:hypothetical protein